MPHECVFDAVGDFAHSLATAGALVPLDRRLGVCVPSPLHRVLKACAGGYGGGDGRGSERMEMEVWPSCLDLGRIEVVAQSVGGDVCAVGACDYEVRGFLAFARLVYELPQLWGYWLCGVARGCFRGFESSFAIVGMAHTQCLRFWIPVLHLKADHLPDSQIEDCA